MSQESDFPNSEENFADAPTSLAEVKSIRSGDSRTWAPRDLLIKLLRDIDRGDLDPKRLMVVYQNNDDHIGHWSSSDDLLHSLGMLDVAKHMLLMAGSAS